MRQVLRALGTVDVASGAIALGAAPWLSDQLGLSVTAVRVVGVFLVVLGVDKIVFSARPAMGRVAMVVEALFAIACIGVAAVADPTALGAALLLGTAVLCAGVATWLFTLQRTPALVAA